ncbi:putative GTP-binding protein EngB [Porphyridium purpureum]|uniref:Putative GTP-binding protein EngB n=1 Tax=Porphyridium purpureum TaxID=35688 RepID=A0A5J4Z0P3_PORPP|nr:putative GTP-binding protein EngB [Porphyridium purpureum]|eukprot:POR1560..scf208_2
MFIVSQTVFCPRACLRVKRDDAERAFSETSVRSPSLAAGTASTRVSYLSMKSGRSGANEKVRLQAVRSGGKGSSKSRGDVGGSSRPLNRQRRPSKRSEQADADIIGASQDATEVAREVAAPAQVYPRENMQRSDVEFIGSFADHVPVVLSKPSSSEVVPEVAFAGRSNVGKSSLLNMMCKRKSAARTSKTPGRTQNINLFLVKDLKARVYSMVDLPGYGFAKMSKSLQKQSSDFIANYLASREALRLVVLLVDIRVPPQDADIGAMDLLAELDLPFLVAATKVDKIRASERAALVKGYAEAVRLDAETILMLSSQTGEGKQALQAAMLDALFSELDKQ